jgi:hypothetical protein
MQTEIKSRGRVAWSSHPSEFLAELELDADPLTRADASVCSESGFLPFDLKFAEFGLGLGFGLSARDLPALRRGEATRAATRQRLSAVAGHGDAAGGRPGSAEEIRQAWSRWYAQHPVPYPHARAAASLRVREVELLRALQGQAVVALQPDMEQLLADVVSWGKLVVEVHHPLGVAWLGVTPSQIRFERGCTLLHDTNRQVVLRGHACTDVFLIHSASSCGLHLFDELGEIVARIHFVQGNQTGEVARALRHFLQHTRISGEAPASGYPNTDRLTRPGWCAIERQVHAADALARLCANVSDALDDGPPMQLALEAPHAILACQNTPVHRSGVHAAANLGTKPCKLHFRIPAVRHAAVCLGPDGQPFLRFHAHDGSCLRLQHTNDNEGSARLWVDQLLD